MNIPFPVIYPRLIAPDWFNADRPCDEDAELTRLEQANKDWLNSITQKFMKRTPIKKPPPEPMEETGSDDDVTANDEVEESEESQDIDDEEEIPTSESPPENNEDESESPEDITEAADIDVQPTVPPQAYQNE